VCVCVPQGVVSVSMAHARACAAREIIAAGGSGGEGTKGARGRLRFVGDWSEPKRLALLEVTASAGNDTGYKGVVVSSCSDSMTQGTAAHRRRGRASTRC